MDFKGKTVLITGATGGFGAAMSEAFAGKGGRLVLADMDGMKLNKFAENLKSKGTKVAILAGDVTDPAHHTALVGLAMSEFGTLDVCVNNAGIVSSIAGLPDITTRDAKAVIDVDLMGVFYAMQAQLPAMETTWKQSDQFTSMVNIASVAGLVGSAYLSIYAAAKHGVVGLTKSAALEYAKRGVRVNAVCPSYAATDMLEKYYDESPKERLPATLKLVRGIPMARVGQVEEIVAAILFAADPANSFMTGETLAVDGGLSAI